MARHQPYELSDAHCGFCRLMIGPDRVAQWANGLKTLFTSSVGGWRRSSCAVLIASRRGSRTNLDT